MKTEKKKLMEKNMKRKTVTALIIIMVIASVMLFAGCITDNAYYSASGKDLGKIDYDMVITNAKKAGYMVDGPYYVNAKQKIGLHPLDIRELDERFGEDYRIFLVKFYYTEDAFFEVTLPRDYGGETRIHFFNESRPDPFFFTIRTKRPSK